VRQICFRCKWLGMNWLRYLFLGTPLTRTGKSEGQSVRRGRRGEEAEVRRGEADGLGRKVRAAGVGWASSGSFDCGACDEAASAFAQDDERLMNIAKQPR
jgi:hypothetical protein